MELYLEIINIDEIIDFFDKHEQALRIKKLIFYTSKDYWENDVKILKNLTFKELILDLYKGNPTLEKLSNSLYQSVENLNRQELYAILANLIISKLGKLYKDSADCTGLISLKTQVRSEIPESSLDRVVLNLEKDKNSQRIKKLIFYVCKNSWESDVSLIESYNIRELILELRGMYTTKKDLSKALFEVVETLNRQNVYSLVAEAIIKEFNVLYIPDYKQTQLINKDNLTIDESEENLEYLEEKEDDIRPNNNFDDEILEPQLSQKVYDPFEVRMELMQYTNPLRVKILLFSLLYHKFNKTERDWSMLKTCTLDDLLFKVFNNYKDINQLEQQISNILESLLDSEANTQAASVIVKSLTSFYEE